ncbi:MAG: M48 family metallopeptidase [Bacteroidales bacterium]|nr:M48 family metallopeptidase [Bacteroidales bacterium]
MSQKNYFLIVATLFFIACSTIPITNRKSVHLLPNSMMLSMSIASYQDFLSQNPPLPSSDDRVQEVRKVGNDISQGVIRFLNENEMTDRVNDFTWEFNVIEDETVNAWCMPGGKIVFYSGILPVAEGLNGIATVMGHEIAHAVAQHGNERMTQQLAIYMGAVTLDYALANEPEKTRDIFFLAYGAGSQLGSLAYSRTHEYEADKLGMVFMAMSGYDPAYAIDFWQRMTQIGGGKPPEFLSTHPSDENRVKALQKFLPEAQKYYKREKKSGGTIRL